MKKFSELIKDFQIKPSKELIGNIDNKNFPFSDNKFFSYNPHQLAYEEYERCFQLYEKRLADKYGYPSLQPGSEHFAKLMQEYNRIRSEIASLEADHRHELEVMAERAIREIYDVPDDFELDGRIKPYISSDEMPGGGGECEECDLSQSSNEEEGEELDQYLKDEINKRIILNSIVHGSSVHIWKSCYYIIAEEIEKIDPNLLKLYNDYSAIVSILMWMFSPQAMREDISKGNAINQGYNELKWEDDYEEEEEDEDEDEDEMFDEETQQEYEEYLEESEDEEDIPEGAACGINLPVLMHELNKAVFEVLNTNCIPDDLNLEELEMYYQEADRAEDEPWHYFLGPTIWNHLLNVMNDLDINISEIFQVFACLSYQELVSLLINTIEDKEEAKKDIKNYLSFFEVE